MQHINCVNMALGCGQHMQRDNSARWATHTWVRTHHPAQQQPPAPMVCSTFKARLLYVSRAALTVPMVMNTPEPKLATKTAQPRTK